jgi:hypothetical protein
MEILSILGDILAGVILGGVTVFLAYIGVYAVLEVLFGAPDEL